MKKSELNIMAIIALIAVLALAVVLLNGFIKPNAPVAPGVGSYEPITVFDPGEAIKANSFSSVEEFQDFVKKSEYSASYGRYYGGGLLGESLIASFGMDVSTSVSKQAPTAGASAESSGGAGGATESRDFSPTNNQLINVDEADIIKTDGNYIYTVSGNTLYIIKAYPGEDAEIVSKIKFDNQPSSLFVNGNHLAVFGNYYNIDFFKEIDFTPRQGMTYFNIYDISDKENPELVKEYKFEGNYFQARMIDDYVYFVTTSTPEYRTVLPTPLIIEGTEKRSMPVTDIYYYNFPYDNPQFANIHAISITNPEEDVNSKTIAVEYSQNMYMSEKNIYITYTEYVNEYELQSKIIVELMEDKLTDSDKALVEKIKQTDNEVLSQSEKESKIMQIIQSYISYLSEDEQQKLSDEAEQRLKQELEKYEYFEFTVINKIGVDEGEIAIKANGKVPGYIMNQFSLDEDGNVLRIATTLSARWSQFGEEDTKSTNNVFALDENLNMLDSLKGMAEGESIYSTRFIGDKLYMVTFRQVDPFFVIDLSNPRDIKELGKLKIPGFSRYLHPYDENTIIGIGREATEQGRTQGLKISLFDVSDFENPKEVAKFVTEGQYAQSTAEYEHKAFLFSKEKELLVIPAYSYTYKCLGEMCSGVASEAYNGAMVFKITKDDIELRGIIDHSKGQAEYYYSAMVERSLYIEELLYTKSPGLLRINKIDDLSSVKSIEFTDSSSPYPVY